LLIKILFGLAAVSRELEIADCRGKLISFVKELETDRELDNQY
jgi:hypothetical protein